MRLDNVMNPPSALPSHLIAGSFLNMYVFLSVVDAGIRFITLHKGEFYKLTQSRQERYQRFYRAEYQENRGVTNMASGKDKQLIFEEVRQYI